MLEALGQQNVAPEGVAERLRDAVVQYRETLARLDALQGARNPTVRALREEARAAFVTGQFDEADRLARRAAESGIEAARQARAIREEAERAERELLLDAAADIATRGDVAMTRRRYLEAAQHYANAAATVPATRQGERRRYLEREAAALFRQGAERGDNATAAAAIERYRELALVPDRAVDLVDWLTAQVDLALALWTLGRREAGRVRLEEAMAVYRAALQEVPPIDILGERAVIQVGLGNTLHELGLREAGTGLLNEAVAAYRAAQLGFPRALSPDAWALTQNNLGNALQMLGRREANAARLQEAAVAYRLALEELTRERVPLDWAQTQNNLGNALAALGEHEADASRIEEGIVAYQAALQERTRERVPLDWAQTQNNLGVTLYLLGIRETSMARLEEAALVLQTALEERTRVRVPLEWAQTQNNLGDALRALGERESGTARLEDAVVAYDACLEVAEPAWPTARVQVVHSNRDAVLAEIARRALQHTPPRQSQR